jgi:hypothetical protein
MGFFVPLAIPFLLLPSTALVFVYGARMLGREKGYLLGFLFYWTVWCLATPLVYLGWDSFLSLFVDQTPLLARTNWPAAVLWALITLVSLAMYGRDFLRAPLKLVLVAIPAATLNGICEELLWRGLYVRAFPGHLWLAVLFPSVGFALWHLVPLQIFSDGSRFTFVLSTFFLGLAYGYIAFQTGSAKWTAISHRINGVLALSGMLGPAILSLLRRFK